jgi:anti-anti-sigma factor
VRPLLDLEFPLTAQLNGRWFAWQPPDTFAVQVDPPSGRITVSGELDEDTAPSLLEAAFLAHFVRETDITVDVSQLSFVGAAGLNALVELYQAQRRAGRTLRVVGAGPHLHRVFRAARAHWLLRDDAGPPADRLATDV